MWVIYDRLFGHRVKNKILEFCSNKTTTTLSENPQHVCSQEVNVINFNSTQLQSIILYSKGGIWS